MKSLVKKIANAFGYKIERSNNPNPLQPRFEQVIRELYGVYKHYAFPTLKELDQNTLALITRLDGTQISEAIYLLNSMQSVKELQGDVCEFGVAQGYTSALIGQQLLSTSKTLWLFDSFEGLPAPTSKDKLKNDIYGLNSIEAYAGTMKHSQEVVINNLRRINFPADRLRIVDGFIEKTILEKRLPERVAFAYVDFDFYNPIKVALEFLDTVLVTNGKVVIDDYDFFSEGAKVAVDEFFERNKERYILEFPIQAAGHFAILTKTQ